MSDVRKAAVAGRFYPGDADTLASTVEALLEAARATRPSATVPGTLRGLDVPHAGYEYSGPIAASAYALLTELRPRLSVVAILGPSHFEPLGGMATAPHHAWRTPLGEVALDADVRGALAHGGASSSEAPHRDEHSMEVQLPFLQRSLPDVAVLPVAVGHGAPRDGAQLLGDALPNDGLLVISTDLSHYHDAETARRLDARTADAVEALDVDALAPENACGVDALRLGLAWARRRGYRIVRLDLRNSADTAGDPWRVVGYGAFAILGR